MSLSSEIHTAWIIERETAKLRHDEGEKGGCAPSEVGRK
jgi:hypothetical protein